LRGAGRRGDGRPEGRATGDPSPGALGRLMRPPGPSTLDGIQTEVAGAPAQVGRGPARADRRSSGAPVQCRLVDPPAARDAGSVGRWAPPRRPRMRAT
jgi:hypothetical protein